MRTGIGRNITVVNLRWLLVSAAILLGILACQAYSGLPPSNLLVGSWRVVVTPRQLPGEIWHVTIDENGRYWLGSNDPCAQPNEESCRVGFISQEQNQILQVHGGAWDVMRDWPDRTPYRHASCIDERQVEAYRPTGFRLVQPEDTACSAVEWTRLPP